MLPIFEPCWVERIASLAVPICPAKIRHATVLNSAGFQGDTKFPTMLESTFLDICRHRSILSGFGMKTVGKKPLSLSKIS